jgi:peroxiredoxin Q/BCP
MTGLVQAAELAVGEALPEVKVKNQNGEMVNLAEAGSEGWTLVYFYPKADTPGCTKQACSLRDSYEKLTDKGVTIFGVSTDGVAVQKEFAEKHELPFTLLADKSKKAVKAFGVPAGMGFAKRQAYLFQDGKLVWRDLKASTEKQAADVLAELGKSTVKAQSQAMEHHVYFWLKNEKQTAEARAEFEDGLRALFDIKAVAGGSWGTPASTEERGVVDNSWDYALAMKFDSVADQSTYQDDPDHHVFVEGFSSWWDKVQVMDIAEGS